MPFTELHRLAANNLINEDNIKIQIDINTVNEEEFFYSTMAGSAYRNTTAALIREHRVAVLFLIAFGADFNMRFYSVVYSIQIY